MARNTSGEKEGEIMITENRNGVKSNRGIGDGCCSFCVSALIKGRAVLMIVVFAGLMGAGIPSEVTAQEGIKYDKNTLDKKGFQKCLAIKKELSKSEKKLAVNKKELDGKESAVQSLGKELDSEKSDLDKKKEEGLKTEQEIADYNQAVESHNKKVQDYDEQVAELKAMAAKYSKAVDHHNKKVKLFSKNCENKHYIQEDMKKGRKNG